MSDSIQSTSALASLLESRLVEWEKARKPQELKLLECYQDKMRIPRDDDTSGTGQAKARKAKSLFIGSTRNKIRAARAKINDALFGNGKMPFDTTPTNEELKEFSDAVEEIVTEQLERMKFRQMMKNGVDTLATYGTGFIFGPLVRKDCHSETTADNSLGYTQIKEEKYEFDTPYFDLASTLDVYPDPEARCIDDGLGVFWVTMESPHTVAAWKNDDSYSNIDQALVGAGDNGNETGSEIANQIRGNVEFWHKDGRIKVARFFGLVPKSALSQTEGEDAAQSVAGEMVKVIVIMAGGVVVKQSESPYGDTIPAYSCGYEEEPHSIWHVGVGENNAPHQKTVNAAFRLFMEGKGMALLGTKTVDRSMFLPTEDFKKYPGKVYQMKPGLSPDERKTAIMENVEPDITGGWLDVIKMSEQFSDDDTGITKYTQGDDSSNLNKTATGISMIMSASSLPIKEVIQNIDSCWIEPIVESIIVWDLKYLEVETVRRIHGEKIAKVWEQIKQFGKSSFMDWQATGTSSFMQKEILTNKLRAFADFAMSNPNTAPLVDARELLEQTWDCMEIGKESPILKEEDGQKIPPQVKQQMDQHQQMIQQLDATVQKMSEELEIKEIERYKAETERMKVEGDLALKAQAQAAQPDVLLAEFAAIKEMLIDVMHGVKDPAHFAALPSPPQEQQTEAAEPQQEPQEPPGQPEQPMMNQPEQPADAGFFTPDEPQQ